MGKACAEAIIGAMPVSSTKVSIRIPATIETSLSPTMLPELRALLWTHAGIVRTYEGIRSGLRRLEAAQAELPGLLPYGHALRARNIHDAAYLILHSASLRKESRGGHFNASYPDKMQKMTTAVAGNYNKYWAPSQHSGGQVEKPVPA